MGHKNHGSAAVIRSTALQFGAHLEDFVEWRKEALTVWPQARM